MICMTEYSFHLQHAVINAELGDELQTAVKAVRAGFDTLTQVTHLSCCSLFDSCRALAFTPGKLCVLMRTLERPASLTCT